MEFSAEMIAGFLGGEIVGDPKAAVSTLAKIEEGTVVPRQSQIRTLHLQLPFVDRDRQQIVRTHGTCAGDDDQSR